MMLTSIIQDALAAAQEPGVQVSAGFSEISWTIIIPLLINAAMLAYLFGGLTQRLKSVEADVDQLNREFEKLRDTNLRTENNLHRIEIVLSKIETRFDLFLSTTSEHSKCPLFQKTQTQAKGDIAYKE